MKSFLITFLSLLPSVLSITSLCLSSRLLTEKLIEGLKSPESSLLLADLLTPANPFNSYSESSSHVNSEMCVDSLIPGLEAPQRHSGQPELIPASITDSLTGEDSLLGCDLLSHSTLHGNQCVSALPPSSSSSCSSAPSGPCLEELPAGQTASDSTFLMSCGEKGNDDEFDPIPVLISKNSNQGGHSRSNSGSSESSIPNLARSLLLVDQLIDL
ncbi:hypothetical protein OYC64_002982 [Pagothenia borchgrevinki]|uniref:Uncharacterized protein n=1 Tax=Pagothenia borchgrevinki TaxID=8213 RepID=A0ABD2HDX2_PAGBO